MNILSLLTLIRIESICLTVILGLSVTQTTILVVISFIFLKNFAKAAVKLSFTFSTDFINTQFHVVTHFIRPCQDRTSAAEGHTSSFYGHTNISLSAIWNVSGSLFTLKLI